RIERYGEYGLHDPDFLCSTFADLSDKRHASTTAIHRASRLQTAPGGQPGEIVEHFRVAELMEIAVWLPSARNWGPADCHPRPKRPPAPDIRKRRPCAR